jgi:hypothetical protein
MRTEAESKHFDRIDLFVALIRRFGMEQGCGASRSEESVCRSTANTTSLPTNLNEPGITCESWLECALKANHRASRW